MPRLLRNLRIDEISSVDRGAGEGCRIMLYKRDNGDAVLKHDNIPQGARLFNDIMLGKAAKGLLRNNLVTFLGASCSELLCSSTPHESHEETC